MYGLMCWNCLQDYYREHGELPPTGYILKSDGTETGITVWFGSLLCRVHATEQLVAFEKVRA